MIKITTYIIFSFVLFFVTSCSVNTNKLMRTGSFMPNDVKLEMTMNDFEFLGEGEVSVEYHKYFGFITIVNTINGKEVPSRNKNIINFCGSGISTINPDAKARRALYEMHVKYPTADFLVPVNIIYEKQGMFLGSRNKQTIKVKAYKVKDK